MSKPDFRDVLKHGEEGEHGEEAAES